MTKPAAFCLLLVSFVAVQSVLAQEPAAVTPVPPPTPKFLGMLAAAADDPAALLATAVTAVTDIVEDAPAIAANGATALASASSALGNAASLAENVFGFGAGIHQHIKDAYLTSFALLVDIVKTVNSLNIAGSNLAAGVVDTAASGIVGAIREDVTAVSDLILDLVTEFGRAVGNGVGVAATLKGPLLSLSPVGVGLDLLEFHLDSLIKFLQGASDLSVANPIQAGAIQPLIAKFTALKAALEGLQTILTGPEGNLLGAIDGALDTLGVVGAGAAGIVADAADGAVDVVGDVVGGAGDVAIDLIGDVVGGAGGAAINVVTDMIQEALGLLGPFIKVLTGLIG